MAHSGEARGQWFLDHDVERGAPDLTSRERAGERRLVDHAPARRVVKIRGRLHAAERIGIDQLLGFRGQRAGEGNEIGLLQAQNIEATLRCPAHRRCCTVPCLLP
jgi:hypothetical protein